MFRSIFILVLSGLAITAAGCSTDFKPDEARRALAINITPGASTRGVYGFSPNPVSIIPRTEVIWTNRDTEAHQITSAGGFFGTDGLIQPNQSYTFTFTIAGSYRYFCTAPGHREEGVINVAP